MRRLLVLSFALVLFRCSSASAPTAPPSVPAPPPAVPVAESVIATVRVNASALNVRAEASTDAAVVTQVRRNELLSVLREDESWMRVRLADGSIGWVASRFVSRDGAQKPAPRASRRGSCQPDSDFAFLETPTLAFSDSGAHGLVVVEASVNVKGTVTGAKVISNSTGDEALGFLAEREIRSAKFSPPIRNCAPRAFIFTYRRTF